MRARIMQLRGVTLVVAAALLAAARAQDSGRCAWFWAIPRGEPPDLPPLDYDGATWAQYPLAPAAGAGGGRDDVCFEEFLPLSRTQLLYMEEEIEGDVLLAHFNYLGDNAPVIGTFLAGTRSLLGAEVRSATAPRAGWDLVVTLKQDYETEWMRSYMFYVEVDGAGAGAGAGERVLVALAIVNIDDNPPLININAPCSIPEGGAGGGAAVGAVGAGADTTCVYNVTDIDGEISTVPMRVLVDGAGEGDDALFAVSLTRYASDLYTVTLTLRTLQPLDYALAALHVLTLTAYDSLPNTHAVTLLAQVENVESRPPRWVEVWAMQQFDEKTSQSFSVRAIDGDTGINKQILYALDNPHGYPFFSIGREDGVFSVAPIDRDALQQEVFQLSIVAHKFDNASYEVVAPVVIVVDDVNDQIPEPLRAYYDIEIPEETPLTLDLGDDFGFYDRDLGVNAQYTVRLESVYPEGAAEALAVAPTSGYQRQTFILSVTNHSRLDYEDPPFQDITIKMVAEEVAEARHVGEATVRLHLRNWNDEEPVFGSDAYEATVDETAPAGTLLGYVLATDRDIGDHVLHSVSSVSGAAAGAVAVDADTGAVRVALEDAFSYVRAARVQVVVQARDTLAPPYHVASATLTVHLVDINNTPPELRLPRGTPSVEENVPAGWEVTAGLTGWDPDSTAELLFEIDWAASYATKQGRETDPAEYHGCVEIETVFPEEGSRGSAVGRVVVRELRPGVTIDFEEFEVLYLAVRLTDLNTQLNEPSAELTLAVMIVDMNDEVPVWDATVLQGAWRVREQAAPGTYIAGPFATDRDGPLYNQVHYALAAEGDTPAGLVEIDAATGALRVADTALEAGGIDADTPPRLHLRYTLLASDCCRPDGDAGACPPPDPTCHTTPAQIEIQITDTNNKVPSPALDRYEPVVYIYENATTGDEVVQLAADDLDRDDIYSNTTWQIKYEARPAQRELFAVSAAGWLHVAYSGAAVLDRDRGEPTHTIFLNLIDNFLSEGDGNRNQVETNVTVVLLDVNDNAPELPAAHELAWSVSEAAAPGARLQPDIYAPDIDEPDTDNSRVSYEILSLRPLDPAPDPDPDPDPDPATELPQLFRMINVDNVTGELEVALPLHGYWGTHAIHIRAYDFGVPQQSSNETYELEVRPYNYHAPQFLYPPAGATLRISRERSIVNGPLYLAGGAALPAVRALDPDGLHAGTVAFSLYGDEEAAQWLSVVDTAHNEAALVLSQLVTTEHLLLQVEVAAQDGGTEPGPLGARLALQLLFVSELADPVFDTQLHQVAFSEGERGLSERAQLPTARDPKNYLCDDDCFPLYYHIVEGDDEGLFWVESEGGEAVMGVSVALQHAAAVSHVLLVLATNAAEPPAAPPAPAATNLLRLSVTVIEGEAAPVWERARYAVGVTAGEVAGRALGAVAATHPRAELAPTVRYALEWGTLQSAGLVVPSAPPPLLLDALSGELTLNFAVTPAHVGHLQTALVATDATGAHAAVPLLLYVVTSANRLYFSFLNPPQQLIDDQDFVAATLGGAFGARCEVEGVWAATDADGSDTGAAELRAHFIDHETELPLSAETIEELRSDTGVIRAVQTGLATRALYLQDMSAQAGASAGLGAGVGSGVALSTVNALLAALCALLAALVLLTLLAACVRTRRLTRRLEALSTTKFGSQDSGLNRAGLGGGAGAGGVPGATVGAGHVPGTNLHALAGSNPVWNELTNAPDFDAISAVSGDSELVGVEEDPQFDMWPRA